MKPLNRSIALVVAALALSACSKHEAPVPSAPGAPLVVTAYDPPPQLGIAGNCALDAINDKPVANTSVSSGTEVKFAGWMADANGNVPSDALFVLKGVYKSYSVALAGGGERLDVAKALGKDGLRLSGYNLVAALKGVASGNYELMIVHGTAPAFCPLNVRLNVTG